MRKVCILLMMLAFAVCQADSEPNPPVVTMIQLIANPDRYNGKEVTLIGFLRMGSEGDTLYLSSEDYRHDTPNGLRLERSPDMMRNREVLDLNYVLVVGTFRAASSGPSRIVLWAGSITNVTKSMLWSDMRNPRSEKLGVGQKPEAGTQH